MSTRVSSRRPSRRRGREDNSSSDARTVLSVDERTELGAPRGDIPHRQGALVQASVVPPSAPIDVEAIEDDVQLLSPSASRTFPRGRNWPRRNHLLTVVLDDDWDAQVGSSGILDDPEFQVTVNNNRQNHPLRLPLINSEVSEDHKNAEHNHKSKQRKCVAHNPESQMAALKEPAFTCGICLGHLTEETSTICGHIFCHGCIKTAIKTQRRCPTCRKFLTVKNIHRIYLPITHSEEVGFVQSRIS